MRKKVSLLLFCLVIPFLFNSCSDSFLKASLILEFDWNSIIHSGDSETREINSLTTHMGIEISSDGFNIFHKDLEKDETRVEITDLAPGKYYDLEIRAYDAKDNLLNYGMKRIFIQRGENNENITLSGVIQSFYFLDGNEKIFAEIKEIDPYFYDMYIDLDPEIDILNLIPYCVHTGEQLLLVQGNGNEIPFSSGDKSLDFGLYPLTINVLTSNARKIEYNLLISHKPSFSLDAEVETFPDTVYELIVTEGKSETGIYFPGSVFTVEAPDSWDEYFWLLNQEPTLSPDGENVRTFFVVTENLPLGDYELSCIFGSHGEYYSESYRFSVKVSQ